MITPTDIANIMYRDCEVFGINVVPYGDTVTGELTEERIVIHAKKQQKETYFKKCFCEVNFCVPDISEGCANSIRLNEIEHEAVKTLDGVFGVENDTPYRYSVYETGMEADNTLKCHYINIRILFEVLNVKEL